MRAFIEMASEIAFHNHLTSTEDGNEYEQCQIDPVYLSRFGAGLGSDFHNDSPSSENQSVCDQPQFGSFDASLLNVGVVVH